MRASGALTEACESKPPGRIASKMIIRKTSNHSALNYETEIKEKKLLIYSFFLTEDKMRVLYLYELFSIGQGSNVSSKHQKQILFTPYFERKTNPLWTNKIL